MTTRYRSWLVMQDSANADLRNLVVSLGLSSTHDVTERPSVTLSMQGDTAVLSTPDVRGLFERIRQADDRRKPVIGFAALPAADLRRMHGRVFLGSVFHVRLSCQACLTPSESEDPYFRRLVELRFVAAQVQESLSTGKTEVVECATPSGAPLLLDPLPLSIERGKLLRLLSDDARALGGVNAVLLPPARQETEGTYFAPRLRVTRDVLAEELGVRQPTAAQPAAVAVWRQLDDPLMRDVLLDGGSIHVSNEDGEPTRAAVRVWGEDDAADPIARYRAKTLLTPSRASEGGLAAIVAAAVARDLHDTLPAPVTTEPALARMSWETPLRPREFDRGAARQTGSWQRFDSLAARLLLRDRDKALETFQERVLHPSRERPGVYADHDLAEVEFIRHLWHTPSDSVSERGWRWALLDLLRSEFAGDHPSVEGRVNGWRHGGHFELRACADRTEVLYPATAQMDEVLRWRLTTPLGIVFKPNAQLILDRASKLDRGYQLV